MNNFLDLAPNIIVGDDYEGFLVLDAWKGFQSRNGPYGSQDSEASSNGHIKVTIEGISVDYVKVSSPAQIAAVHYLVDHAEEIRDSMLSGLLNQFSSWKEIYEDDLPRVTTISQFKNLIGLSYLHVLPEEKDGYAYIGFELGCTWDEEHGAGVMMHKERVIEVGQADTSFDHWPAKHDMEATWIEQVKQNKGNPMEPENKEKVKAKLKPWWQFWQ